VASGDSLDGTLAASARAERPRYGYYIDHLADALSTGLVGIGSVFTAPMHLTVALVLVVAYLALSINTYLESQALGVFRLGYGRLGPTEAASPCSGCSSPIALGAHASLSLPPAQTLDGCYDLVGLGRAGAMTLAGGAPRLANLRVAPRAARAGGALGVTLSVRALAEGGDH
jgi:hypothetical protein